jgi:hypothetical protein
MLVLILILIVMPLSHGQSSGNKLEMTNAAWWMTQHYLFK